MSIPTYPKLYSLAADGKKTYEWSIEIRPLADEGYEIVTSHGLTDGKKVVHSSEIKEGKAKRTILEQATLEANRKWKNKKEKELYVENIENVANEAPVRPMLANKFSFDQYEKTSRGFKIKFPAYVQRKYDGIRCIAYLSKEGNVVLESRKGTVFENFDGLKEELKTVLRGSHGVYLDGELFTKEFDFETISGLVRLTAKKCGDKERELINRMEYHIYDVYNAKEVNMKYEERYRYLNDAILSTEYDTSRCKKVETILVDKLEDVKRLHDQFVGEGFEGIMIRDRDGTYEINKRSKYLQKYKEFTDEEFKIVGYHEGTGDEKGTVIWDCLTTDGKPFAVRPRGTFEARKKLFDEADQYIGKWLTVVFQEFSADGIPRFPVGKAIRENGI